MLTCRYGSATTMSVRKAFRWTTERYKRGDGKASNYWVANCIACKTAYERYREAVAACNGDNEAIAKIDVVHPAEALPGREDRMAPHLLVVDMCALVRDE
ncbi:hypothetical protein I4F81_007241 [Pyropia yezoensis]|uniref:Uncharacterized protein n=1 Tax=Pyropia yezoensis TaxID=2788 RepID=A0ACC3C3F7_PYRYE|nr:hypothetical protein I4F81_007241 [Neopyropia yezoensis]